MHVTAPQPPLRQVPLQTWARRRRTVAALVAAAGLAAPTGAAALPAAAATGAPAPTGSLASTGTSAPGASAVAVAPVPTSRQLLTGTDLRSFQGGRWATRRQDLTRRVTLEPLASCTNDKATLSASVSRDLAQRDAYGWVPEGRHVGQRVVRYQPGRGDDVIDLFRGVVKQCPTRTLPSGSRERWSLRVDTRGTGTDTLVIRREFLDPVSPWAAYYVVVRDKDTVNVIHYWPGEVVGDEPGAKQLAALAGSKLRTAR